MQLDRRSLHIEPISIEPQASLAVRHLNRAITILHESMGDVLPSQSEIAGRLNLTPSSVSRMFRRCVGKNYMDYLNDWRIGVACRALLETNDSIVDISLTAGFENLSNFHRRFKDRKGMTPAQWRAVTRRAKGGAVGRVE